MTKKGQAFQKYSLEIKNEALRLREQCYSFQQEADRLYIIIKDTVKTWWRKYPRDGHAFHLDNRGRKKNT